MEILGALLIVLTVVVMLTITIGYFLGKHKGRETDGALLGLFLGMIGWVITLCLSDKRRRCPQCQEVRLEGARVCRCCGHLFGALTAKQWEEVDV